METEKSLGQIRYETTEALLPEGHGFRPWKEIPESYRRADEAGIAAAIDENNRRTGAKDGWRLLEEGEVIREGDEYYKASIKWVPFQHSLGDLYCHGRFDPARRRHTTPAAEPKPSLWHVTAEGGPTEADADEYGNVIWGEKRMVVARWNAEWVHCSTPKCWARHRDLLAAHPLPEPEKPKDAFGEWCGDMEMTFTERNIARCAWSAALAAGKGAE